MSPKVVVLDIERVPGLAHHVHRGRTIEGDFWDLSDWKTMIGYRLPAASVLTWPKTICAAWRWQGQRAIDFAAVWEDGGEDAFHATMHGLYEEADIVIGHNIDAFDTKKLASGWVQMGLFKPAPWKSIDTLKIARQEFGFESNTLDSLCKFLGIKGKVDKYDPEVAKAALAGDVKAQRKLTRYNRGDISASEGVAERFAAWAKNPPNFNLWADEEEVHCVNPLCGSTRLQLRGEQVVLAQVYQRYQCQNCGKWGKGTEIVRRAGGLRNV